MLLALRDESAKWREHVRTWQQKLGLTEEEDSDNEDDVPRIKVGDVTINVDFSG
jgi:hypothetical protein